ncbi:MAG TPA: YceI family protein [Saprospiraceae bacterium]|nr:YceI family protein [Saprospiraceae bacterium]
MKPFKILFPILTVLSVFALSFTNPSNGGGTSGTVKVNTKTSKLAWKAYKVTGAHEGFIQIKDGSLQFADGVLTGGNFVIDMTTITCTDLEGEWNQKLVGHIKSDDFFGVESHPTAKFVITKAIPYGTPGSYKIVGDLTIKGKTNQIKFNANVKDSNGAVNAEAKIVVDRSDYDVRYGSGSFFDSLGDKTIYDEFDLTVNLVAGK